MRIALPELSLVALVGVSGSGKSSFARRHFKPSEVLSSDAFRALVSDDENDQSATEAAFDTLYYVARKRLIAGRLTVIDATNVQPEARKPIVALAREQHCLPVAIVLNVPPSLCAERNSTRPNRPFGPHVVRNQHNQLRRSLRRLRIEGFRHVFVLGSVEEIDAATVERQPLWNNLEHEIGPFDIIGDVHGCLEELETLLARLGYARNQDGVHAHPAKRKAVFLGDLVDRGPDTPGVLRVAMAMRAAGTALCVPGNHDVKLLRWLRGRKVRPTHGLAESIAQLEREPQSFRDEVARFVADLVSHYVLDGRRLVVAHAGLAEPLQGRASGPVRQFALYGETTGETDEYGLPVRYDWAADYRGRATVVYGHTPVPEPEWLNNTLCIDTGCVFGGRLSALRYPEREIVSVPATREYYAPVRPLVATPEVGRSAQQEHDDVLDAQDVLGKRRVQTRLRGTITIRAENAAAALEAMSRFAVDPRWLIHLPPTMSPAETSRREGLLEHPDEAFAYYRDRGVARVVCEAKHMGSRAIAVVCRDAAAARRRFGLETGEAGIVFTRTGRRFFSENELEIGLLGILRRAAIRAGLWEELKTDWLLLDAELMPWSAKAQELIERQYAAVGAAMRITSRRSVDVLKAAAERGVPVSEPLERAERRLEQVEAYAEAYRAYCWPVESLTDLRLAPFHLLASEGRVHIDREHAWHLEVLDRLVSAGEGGVLLKTERRLVELEDTGQVAEATRWWKDLTDRGGEGMVVKPASFIARDARGIVQPAIKCRGREYLRIIYGPEYTAPDNLRRLRARGLSAKRSLATRELALGVEALERFVRGAPLRDVHECVFGVLALEAEPVDPRL